MRILFLEDDPQYVHGLPDGFRELGCDVMVQASVNKEELKLIYHLFKPDVIFTCGWGKLHSKENLKLIGNFTEDHRLTHCYWATEDPRWTEEWSLPFVEMAKPTHIFTIDPDSVDMYRQKGFISAYLPWACNPQYHQPVAPKEEYRCDIAVVATAGITWSGFRKKAVNILMKPLVKNGYNIKVWGKRWDEQHECVLGFTVPSKYLQGKLPYEETNAVYSSAKIVLGIQNRVDELNSRTFEIMGAGGFMLAPDTEGIRKYFTPDKHLAVSGSEQQTLEMVDYYLKHAGKRQKIAYQGRQLVIDKHTYRDRAATILNVLGGK
ncbi:glycosyltransferase [Peptococcaceae bacterium 1198_IL3148]